MADEKGDTQIIDILSRHADRATLTIIKGGVAAEGSFGYQKWQVFFLFIFLFLIHNNITKGHVVAEGSFGNQK